MDRVVIRRVAACAIATAGVVLGAFWGISAARSLFAFLSAPELRSPPNETLLSTIGPVTLAWDAPPATTQYHLQVIPFNGDGPGIDLIRDAETSYTIPPPAIGAGPYILLPDMTYTWRVRATDKTTFAAKTDSSWGPWSQEWTFTTPPAPPDAVQPTEPYPWRARYSLTPTLVWAANELQIFYVEI